MSVLHVSPAWWAHGLAATTHYPHGSPWHDIIAQETTSHDRLWLLLHYMYIRPD